MKNIFCVDLEEWFHCNLQEGVSFDQNRVRVVENTERLLTLFSKHNVKATFFVLGYIAENHSDLVKRIWELGHEIGCHGYAHQLVYRQTKEEFRYDVEKAKDLLESVINEQVIGYRAPSWSITEHSLWALEILQDVGFRYDSSIFPFYNFLYGIGEAPRFFFDTVIYGENLKIKEIPPSTVRIVGKNIPFSGGFYLRFFPYFFIDWAIKRINGEGNPSVCYIHPREIDPKQPKLKLGFKDSFIHYFGVNHCEKKLERIFEKNEFIPIKEYYRVLL